MGYKNDMKREESAVQEAASGLESVQNLMRLLLEAQQHQLQLSSSSPSSSYPAETDYRAVADAAVSKFKNVISLLSPGRTGHARFRRAPLAVSPSSGQGNIDIIQSKGSNDKNKSIEYCYQAEPIRQIFPHSHQLSNQGKMVSTTSFNFSSSSSAPNSFATSLVSDQTGENSLCCKRKCSSSDISGSRKCGNSSSGRCHCSKRRTMRTKRVVRVPAISLKLADIPPDDFSWRKYGQKPIKGSPHPRGYYKCSSLRGCPARKHVERALDDPTMLIVTYECEHNHSISILESSALILESS